MEVGPDVERIVAPNPGPMTLDGTNTYLVDRDPSYVIDPGPADRRHIEAVREAGAERGGIAAVLLTHSHGDHADGADAVGARILQPGDGAEVGPLTAIATPGHAADHVCLLWRPPNPAAPGREEEVAGVLFSGDLILGEGSSFVPPRDGGGSLGDYMQSLLRLQRLDLELIYPGHGPPIPDPQAKIAEYIEHREMRERRLVAALDRGERSRANLLDEVWNDIPAELRGAGAVTMQSHLEKLADEGRLPGDLVE